MAGSGKKTFTAGDVLTASDVNNYLMDQTVMVFGGTAARASAIPTPSEGMFAVTTDNDQVDYYNGSDWVSALPVGAWQSWAPTLTGGWSNTTGGAGTWSAFYTQIGKTVIVYGQYTLGAAGNAGANLQLTLPVAGTRTGIMFTGRATIAGSNYLLSGRTVTGSVMSLEVINAAGTYTTLAQLNTTVPATWATGSSFTFNLTYEAA
jgi:hypothetical protein